MGIASIRARNNKLRGHAAERALAKKLNEMGLPIKRVPRSGALKMQGEDYIGDNENYMGDLILTIGKKKYRIEVKTRNELPSYITNMEIDGIEGFCLIFTEAKFLSFLRLGLEPDFKPRLIPDGRCKTLHTWFDQDGSAIVAMRAGHKRTWYYAVDIKYLKSLGGKI